MRKFLVLTSVLAASALIAPAASADTSVPVQRFHSVTIEGEAHVTFIHGAQQRVVLKEGDTKNTPIYVKDGDLVFKPCPGKGWFGWGHSCPAGYRVVVEITTPDLSGIEIDGSGVIASRGAFPKQPKLDVEINGSGRVDFSAIPSASSEIDIRGSGKVKIAAQNDLDVEIAGSGTVLYSGAPRISQHIMGSGTVESTK